METFLHLANPLKRGHCRANLLCLSPHGTGWHARVAVGGLTGGQGSDTAREKTPIAIVDGGNDPEPMIRGGS